MTTSRLLRHYEDKYAEELGTEADLQTIPLGIEHPTDRFQAACKVLPTILNESSAVLELGAGDGRVAHSLHVGGVKVSSYTLADVSNPRLEGLKRRLTADHFKFAYADADNLSEDVDGKYDVVVMVALIEHLIDPLTAMSEVAKVLKPGGCVYIDTPNIAKWTRRAKLLAGRFPSTASQNEGLRSYYGHDVDLFDEGHLHYFTFRSLELMLTQRCGFSRVESCGYYLDGRPFGAKLGNKLARRHPELFSELACLAYL